MIDKDRIWKSVKSERLRKNVLSWMINIIIYSKKIQTKFQTKFFFNLSEERVFFKIFFNKPLSSGWFFFYGTLRFLNPFQVRIPIWFYCFPNSENIDWINSQFRKIYHSHSKREIKIPWVMIWRARKALSCKLMIIYPVALLAQVFWCN